ncbi:unnamed protein product [Schistosoma margrebowiei]|uniref:Uncharacterized protein n=1 Tax=Schistosoma margrebowiei TaxID=48269 RepID=A0A183ML41_9TREM|nr:unnamed protein product [Schistosoma margrebowiei]
MEKILLYPGHKEEHSPHTEGIAQMLSKEVRNALIGWKSHGSLIIKASFKTKKDLLKEETTMEDNWENIKEALTSMCHEFLDRNTHHHMEWISIEKLKQYSRKEKQSDNNQKQ